MRIRALLIAGATLVVLAVSLVLTWRWSTQPGWASSLWYRSEYRESLNIIYKVEDFRREKGRLPVSLNDLGMSESLQRPCYQRLSASEYQVWFGTSLGESLIYDSATQTWR